MSYIPAHHCMTFPCPICQPTWPQPLYSHPVGCICPPTSEKTCENPTCPRKGIRISASGITTSDSSPEREGK